MTNISRPVSWTSPDFQGLSGFAFINLAHSLTNGESQPPGFFELVEDEVRFSPRTYLLRKATRLVKEVAHGELPYCDLMKLTEKFPTLLPEVQSSRDFIEKQCHDHRGNPYKFHFVSHYAIGDAGLNNTAKKCLEILGSERWVNTGVSARANT